jgi:hypothetical protein
MKDVTQGHDMEGVTRAAHAPLAVTHPGHELASRLSGHAFVFSFRT